MRKRKVTHSIAGFTPLDSKHLTGFTDEDMEWLNLTPAQRILETTKLWKLYIALGGNLDPEPNPQSPFYFEETSC